MSEQNIGTCNRCSLGVPQYAIDGEVARDGHEYKAIWGNTKTNEVYHYLDPRYENCWDKEKRDPNSDWWDGHFVDSEDDSLAALRTEEQDHDNI